MRWINNTDVHVNTEESDQSKRIIFTQVGWLNMSGKFYSLQDGVGWCENGGFSPVFVEKKRRTA